MYHNDLEYNTNYHHFLQLFFESLDHKFHQWEQRTLYIGLLEADIPLAYKDYYKIRHHHVYICYKFRHFLFFELLP